jgi:hypothetical protein
VAPFDLTDVDRVVDGISGSPFCGAHEIRGF